LPRWYHNWNYLLENSLYGLLHPSRLSPYSTSPPYLIHIIHTTHTVYSHEVLQCVHVSVWRRLQREQNVNVQYTVRAHPTRGRYR
jgi:hypothetical protein